MQLRLAMLRPAYIKAERRLFTAGKPPQTLALRRRQAFQLCSERCQCGVAVLIAQPAGVLPARRSKKHPCRSSRRVGVSLVSG